VQEIHDHKKHVDEQLLKIETRQKETMAKYEMLTHLFVLPWTFLLHRLFTTLERR
jgi:hypothetical protein